MADSARNPQAAPFPTPTLAEDILNAVEGLVTLVNGEGELVYVSPAVKRILGYEVSDVLGDGWWSKVYSGDPDLAQAVRTRLIRTARGEIPVSSEAHKARVFTASGEERWLLWRDSKGPGDLLIGIGQDLTELHEAETLIERREEEFSAIFENASDGMLILNNSWIFEQANQAACKILELDEDQIVGKQLGDLQPTDVDFAELREKALHDGTARANATFRRKDGERRDLEVWLKTNFRPGHHLMMQRDITEQRRMQTQLSQAHRLESVGRLAGGVAHDFNNMLTAIRGYAELLQRSVAG